MKSATTTLDINSALGDLTLDIEFSYTPGERAETSFPYAPATSHVLESVDKVTDQKSGEEIQVEGCFASVNTQNIKWQHGRAGTVEYWIRSRTIEAEVWNPYTVQPGEMLYPWNFQRPVKKSDSPDRWKYCNIVSRVYTLEEAIRNACLEELEVMSHA